MSVLEGPLCFVDIETNGLNHVRGRAIEVAVIRVEGGEVTRTFHTLLDPETELPYYITNLTGITTNDVKKAPTFDQIADELADVLQGAVFVAHNVRFDYSFLKAEFKRCGMDFLPKQLCTVKLSRALYPHERSHKLENLIRRHGFTYSQRHRAYDDAAILLQFIRYVRKHFPPEQVEAAVARQLKQPALPKSLEPELVRNLPETTGVYIFEDEQGRALYVGKSVNVKKRVLSHFGRDHAESKEFKISQTIRSITVHETPGELAALLLESRLVKELQPIYNRQLRRVRKLIIARLSYTHQGYAAVQLEEADGIDPDSIDGILAVYATRGKARRSLEDLLKQFELCPKLLGLEKAAGTCFLYQLHKCRGACAGKETASGYSERLLAAFERQRIQAWPYDGPVLVNEQEPQAVHYGLIIDQWCVLAEVRQDEQCDPEVRRRTRTFDLDTYKILQSFMSDKRKRVAVNPVRGTMLHLLLG